MVYGEQKSRLLHIYYDTGNSNVLITKIINSSGFHGEEEILEEMLKNHRTISSKTWQEFSGTIFHSTKKTNRTK